MRSTFLQGRGRISRTPCHRVRLRPHYGAAMSAPSGANTASRRAYGGGPHRTTAPSPWDHCGLCRFPATAGGVRVLPEEHRILEDDFRQNVSAFSALTGSAVVTCSRVRVFSTRRWALILRSILVPLSCTRWCFQRSRQRRKFLFNQNIEVCGTASSIDWNVDVVGRRLK